MLEVATVLAGAHKPHDIVYLCSEALFSDD